MASDVQEKDFNALGDSFKQFIGHMKVGDRAGRAMGAFAPGLSEEFLPPGMVECIGACSIEGRL